MRSLLIGLAGTGFGLLLIPGTAAAADITVTTTVDELDVNGTCSLREAVIAANTNAAVDGCPAGDPDDAADSDVIRLAAGRYVLSIPGTDEDAAATGDLDLLGDVYIRGDFAALDAQTVIDGAGIDRVFDVHSVGGDVGLAYLVVTGGSIDGDGGAVLVRGDESLAGTACTTSSRLSALNRLLITGNVAGRGGGVYIGPCGWLDVEYISIADNRATGDGGGVYLAQPASVTFVSGTISGNVAGGRGGGLYSVGESTGGIYSSTVAHNAAAAGGGVWIGPSSAPAFTLNSTIVAHSSGGDCVFGTGSTDVRYTLATDDSCGPGLGILPSTDPMLTARERDPVAYRLQPGSPAIDTGDPSGSCLSPVRSDQFGNLRALDGDGDGAVRCDIGSYEAPEISVSPPDEGSGSLPDTAMQPAATSDPIVFLMLLVALAVACTRWLFLDVRPRRPAPGTR